MGDSKSRTSLEPAAPLKTSTASQIRPLRPVEFGRYELLGRLRLGGMAELFRARESDGAGRIVAIKRILPSFTDEQDYLAMFADEARLALRLKHAAIVEAFEIGQVGDELYIALEYVYGNDLGAALHRAREQKQPLPPSIVCRIALELCSALEYAHTLRDEHGAPLGIVHRDVSPQNILISSEGDVKLIDFGIAKSSEQLMRTQAGLLKGKHGYLSPEQASGRALDHRSDLFSLGVCLYEMLSAQRLFQGQSDFSTLERVRRGKVEPLRQRNAEVPERLAAIVHRALSTDPGLRFPSAAEMGRALARFAKQHLAQCDRTELAAFMRDCLPGGSYGPRTDQAAAGADPTTGLLDAFDGLEPPSQVSAAMLEPGAEPLRELEGAGANSPFERDEPTRVVQYQSMASGEVVEEPTQVAELSADTNVARVRRATPTPTQPRRRRPSRPTPERAPETLLEWDEEELSTHVYDQPASAPRQSVPAAALPRPRSLTPAPTMHAESARPRANSRPVVIHVPGTLASAPPIRVAALTPVPRTAPVTLPSAAAQPIAARGGLPRVLAVCAGVLVAVATGIWLAREPQPSGLRLTTEPVDAMVQVDGVVVTGHSSPFLITNLKPDVTHQIEVSKPGFRSWHSQLVLRPGQELPLGNVQLAREQGPYALGKSVSEPKPAARVEAQNPEPVLGPITVISQAKTGPTRVAHPAPRSVPRPRKPLQVPAAEQGTAILRVNTRPWSRIYIDGRLVGDTPQSNLVLSAGSHNVTLVNPDFNLRKVLTVQLKPGDRVTKVLNLAE